MTTQQLEMLNMSLQKQQEAIITLINLQSAGISESEIVELIGVVNEWRGIGLGHGNGNNNNSNSNMNGTRASGGKANEFRLNV